MDQKQHRNKQPTTEQGHHCYAESTHYQPVENLELKTKAIVEAKPNTAYSFDCR
jgi:hypothetical protein